MKQRQHIFQSWVIEVITVLLASTISFPISDALGVRLRVKHSPFCHGSLLCCSKTHLPFIPLSVGTYNISCFFSPPQAYAI